MASFDGNAVADDINGTSDADTLTGNGGDDTLRGLIGADSIIGGDGDDLIASNTTIAGGFYGQYVNDSGTESDTLIGGIGDDWIFAGYGDVIDGGAGRDRLALDWRGAPNGVTLNLAELFFGGTVTIGGGTITGINGITEVRGSAYADRYEYSLIVAPVDPNDVPIFDLRTEIWGYGGDDVIFGWGPTAFIDGGEGNDTIAFADTLLGGDGNDRIFGGSYIDGGAGNDSIDASFYTTYVHGGPGNDSIGSDRAATTIYGDDGNDALRAYSNDLNGAKVSDTLDGGAGNDVLVADGGGDLLIGGTGNDTYYGVNIDETIVELAGEGYDTVLAVISYILPTNADIELFSAQATQLAKNLNLTGSLSSQLIIGDRGNNVLRGGGATTGNGDTLHGLAGDDTYIVDGPNTEIEELANLGTDIVYVTSAAGPYVLTNGAEVETIAVLDAGTSDGLSLTGNSFSQTIIGNAGNNALRGGGGADTLTGLGGNDVYTIDSTATVVREAAGEGTDTLTVTATAGSYLLNSGASVELLRAEAGSAAINIGGNEFSQRIEGNDGSNILSSGGGGGVDTLVGGLGDDTYRVFSTGDVIDDTGGFDTLYVSGTSYFLYSTAAVEYLSSSLQAGTEPIYLVGNGASQVIAGNYGDNILNGRGGDGQGLPDTLIGLFGNDTYAVFGQGDVVREAAGQGQDIVYANISYQLRTGTEVEALAAVNGSAADAGSAFTLRGNEGAQTIVGNNAANVLDGRGGNDVLIGLGGADVFAFTSALGTGNVDTIQDFGSGDRIGLSTDIFAAVTSDGIAAGEFVIGTAAQDADDRLIYDQATGRLFYDADGNGTGAAVLFAQLTPGAILSAASFVAVGPVSDLPAI